MSQVPFAELLRLEAKGDDRFVVRSEGSGFLYGGLTMAVALRAAAATVDDDKLPLSLRASFLAGGDWGGPHELTVTRVMDSRGFAVRRVELVNQGALAVVADATFHHPEEGEDLAHVEAPRFPVPEDIESSMSMRTAVPVGEVRPAPAPGFEREHPYWARLHQVADDPVERSCGLAFLSDYMVISTPFEPGSGTGEGKNSRTLEHALWFHRPVVDDDWWYVDCQPLSIAGGRFVSRGTLQSRSGILLASFVQEGFVRPARPGP